MGGITSQEMQELENNSGISKLDLMENAGRSIFEILQGKQDLNGKKVLIICYHGNNGGDGFVAARYLADICEVNVLFLGDEDKLKKEAAVNYEKLSKHYHTQLFKDPNIDYDEYDIIIDAIFGTGIGGEIRNPIAYVIDFINDSKAFKVSIDIPSGLDPDTGESSNKAVNPDMIITMHAIKKGLEKFKEKTIIADIGIKDQ